MGLRVGLHRWTAPRRGLSAWLTTKFFATVLGCVGSRAAPDEATLTEESRASQRLAAGPYDAISTMMAGKELGLCIARGISVILAPRCRVATQERWQMAMPRSKQHVAACLSPCMLCHQNGVARCFIAPWRMLLCQLTNSSGWIVLISCCASQDIRCKPQQLRCVASMGTRVTSPERSLHAHQTSSDQSAATASRLC